MSFKVFIYSPLPKLAQKIIQDSGVDITYVSPKEATLPAVQEAIADCDAMVEDKTTHIGVGKEVIDAGKKLKIIISPSIGYETIDAVYAQEQGIYVANSAGASTNAVAEGVIFLMLACNRNAQLIDQRFRKLRKDYPFFDFEDPTVRGVELRGKILGLVGCGAIGRAVADIASHGFGMRVIGYDPYLKNFPDSIEQRETREEIFSESDFVSLHLPSMPSTVHSIGRELFARMKPAAYFINAARGNIVCQQELIEALEQKKIAGAGLDTYDPEPIDEASYRLFELPNVVLTPHSAAFTKEASENYSRFEAQNILDAACGKAPSRRVNRPENPRLKIEC